MLSSTRYSKEVGCMNEWQLSPILSLMRSGDDGSVGYSKLFYMTASSTHRCHFALELASSGCNSREMYSIADVVQWAKNEGDIQGKENETRENLKENRRRFNGRERSLLRWAIDGLGRFETLSQGNIKRLVQKLTRSLTRGIAFLFLRSGMLSMLYRAPPILETTHTQSRVQHPLLFQL